MPLDNFTIQTIVSKMNIKQSISNPAQVDVGNRTIQGRLAAKTVQMAYFTCNQNAVKRASEMLAEAGFPFATVQVSVNRDLFRLEVGDPFLFSNTQYGITDMVLRVIHIEEDDINSERIIITGKQDKFAIINSQTFSQIAATNHATPAPVYDVLPFDNELALEAPYVLTGETVQVLLLAARKSGYDLGFGAWFSLDGGSSYALIRNMGNIVPYGTLNAELSADGLIIDDTGILVTFPDDNADALETISWADVLAGTKNVAVIGSGSTLEIASFQTITPVAGTIYRLTGLARGRYGTIRQTHAAGTKIFIINQNTTLFSHTELTAGATRHFKLVPYNRKQTGNIADATAEAVALSGLGYTPYRPVNFEANGDNFAARYTDDIVLTWSGRIRGSGAGIGTPGTVLPPSATHEGLYKIQVYVGAVLMRTVTAIDALTWTYTQAMNIADNGALAGTITFKLTNYINTYESPQAEIACYNNARV